MVVGGSTIAYGDLKIMVVTSGRIATRRGWLRRVDGVVVAWKLGFIVERTPTPPARHRRDRRIDGVGTSRPDGGPGEL